MPGANAASINFFHSWYTWLHEVHSLQITISTHAVYYIIKSYIGPSQVFYTFSNKNSYLPPFVFFISGQRDAWSHSTACGAGVPAIYIYTYILSWHINPWKSLCPVLYAVLAHISIFEKANSAAISFLVEMHSTSKLQADAKGCPSLEKVHGMHGLRFPRPQR